MNNIAVVVILLIGAIIGFLSGLLGKGGSAIATPSLQIFAHVHPYIALASPLPATFPTTISASIAYRKKNLIQSQVVKWSILLGIPATILGSMMSEWIGGNLLMIANALFVLSLGISFFIVQTTSTTTTIPICPFWKIAVIALFVGFYPDCWQTVEGCCLDHYLFGFKNTNQTSISLQLACSGGVGTSRHYCSLVLRTH